jgi:hypothetical protein
MSTISNASAYNASQYYQLSGQNQSNTGATSSVSTDLASLLGTDGTNSSSSSVSDILNLSPAAQSILDGLNTSNNSSNSSADSTGDNASFLLTPAQQNQISAILAKYKDAPQTQATFDQIQNDLNAAGLGPQQLAQEDSNQSFNATQIFLDALNGQADAIPTANDSTEQTKSANYMQNIISEWKGMSSQSAPSGTASTDTTAAGSAA